MVKRDDGKKKADKPKAKAKAKKTSRAKKPAETLAADGEKKEDAPKFRSPMQQINEKDIRSLLRQVINLGKQASESSGSAGALIKLASDKKNLDKKAFGMIKGLVTMSPERRATSLACFDHYREQCKEELGETEETKDMQLQLGRPEAGDDDTPRGSTKKIEKPDGERDLRPASMRDGRDEKPSQSQRVDEIKRAAGLSSH